MKYVFLVWPILICIIISMIIGAISFLWRFKTDDFRRGSQYLDRKFRWGKLIEG